MLRFSHGDKQNSTGYINDYNNLPAAVDIIQDGRYAIFGDVAVNATVEVSNISSGKLTATLPYILGTGPTAVTPGINSSSVPLDEGMHVQAGCLVALSGRTAPPIFHYLPHLHFEVHKVVPGLQVFSRFGARTAGCLH